MSVEQGFHLCRPGGCLGCEAEAHEKLANHPHSDPSLQETNLVTLLSEVPRRGPSGYVSSRRRVAFYNPTGVP